MKSLIQGAEEYIAMKKAMGFSFYDQELKIKNFCDFMESHKHKYITIELAKRWALSGAESPTWWHARLLSIVRAFAVYWRTIEPKTELWPENYWPIRYQRKNPYIYRNEEIQNILTTCLGLGEGLRPLSFYTLFGTIAACGLRVSEALALTIGDIDLVLGIITVCTSKFNKSRAIPVHASTLVALKKYSLLRDAGLKARDPKSPFFISPEGTGISDGVAAWTFNKVALKCGVRTESRRGPRIHDLRHTFVVRTLEAWYREGKNLEPLLPILSAYVGHAQPGSTFWYMTITPELMSLASERLDRYMGGLSQ